MLVALVSMLVAHTHTTYNDSDTERQSELVPNGQI